MKLARVAFRNIWRNKLRTLLSMLAVSVVMLTFILLRTVLSAWTAAAEHSAKDRVATRNKVSFVMPLPLRYVEEIRQIEGVQEVALATWFGGKDSVREDEFFPTVAVQPKLFLDVYDEVAVEEEQKEDWFRTKNGALVGDSLAKLMGWKVGDRITLLGSIYPGEWDMVISGIYTATRKSVDRSTLYFNYDYLNDSLDSALSKDVVGWMIARVDDPSQSANVIRAIDQHFEERELQTLSMSERALNNSFLGMFTAILKALDVVSIVILLIMTLILGNTIAMGVRERTHEYGVLRAIGFLPHHLMAFVFGEAAVMSAIGGTIGVLLSYPLVERGLGRALEENMGGFFPFFRIEPSTAALALVLSAGLGLVAAAIPARAASRLRVVDSLRTTG